MAARNCRPARWILAKIEEVVDGFLTWSDAEEDLLGAENVALRSALSRLRARRLEMKETNHKD
ncbi:MAG: hypothetical protein JRG95_25230 [Deltaproteobacteria bacterium]|nr:hypothetical protein [Deltaproteobacteria bacterium]